MGDETSGAGEEAAHQQALKARESKVNSNLSRCGSG
jgi:hypothetical protein